MPFRLLVTMLLLLAASARADEAGAVQRLLRSGDLPAALQRADRAVAASPQDARLRFLRGVVLSDMQRDADAMAAFQALAQDFPELPEPYNNIALLHARAGRLPEARSALETALRNNPDDVIARQNLGDIYLRLAVQAWEQVAAVAPGELGVQRKLQLARDLIAQLR